MSDAVLTLQAIRAKLQQLQMQQQQGTKTSNTCTVVTPSSTQTSGTLRTADLTDKNTSSSLLMTEKASSGTSVLHQQVKVNCKANNTSDLPAPPSTLLAPSSALLAPALLPSSSTPRPGSVLNRTTDLTDRNLTCNLHTAENTATFEVEDHKARMRKIETEGNSPEEWKAYIDFLKTVPSEGDIHIKPLTEAYSRAFTGILNSRDHRNEMSVRLIMDYVHFCSERFEWDTVDTILDLAREHLQGFAVIIVSSAEVKIFKGDHEKALSILTKALAKGKAQPKELIIRAIKSAEAGQCKLLSDQERKLQAPWVLRRLSNQDTSEFKMPLPASGYTDSQIDMVTDAGNLSSGSINSTDLPLLTHPPSATKQPLRHYNSTPDIHSSAAKAPWSQIQSSKLKEIVGKPMRVRNSKQQHAVHLLSQDKEEDTDFMNSIKPLYPMQVSTGRFASLASSGYQSDMTIPTEDSTPGQAQASIHREPSQSAGPGASEHRVFSEHNDIRKPPQPSHHPPATTSAAPATNWAAPAMSTPSCRGPQMLPAGLQTPSGEVMETVTVNGEQYCLLKKVGRGGSAQVYMVLDASKNIRALKVVDLEGAGLEVVDGFRNEISLLQRLQYCDSVIKMFNFELNEELNRLYVVLEFGETDLSGFFSTRSKYKQGLDSTLIKFYWGEMLRAVNALHKEGIIHSDLKPANFLLVAGNLKLIDFGIANALQQDKTSVLKDSRVGTPSYMSPEAIMAACDDTGDDSADEKENLSSNRPKYKVGVRSDVWSLGCILYNMVYGRTPFQHIKNNMAKLQAITNPTCTIKFPDIPDPLLMDVLKKCLTRVARLRPTTEELLAHPYLMNKDKKSDSHTPPAEAGKIPTVCSAATTTPSSPGTKPVESRRLQELLKSHLVQGSPRTANAVNRVMDLLQELESGKQKNNNP